MGRFHNNSEAPVLRTKAVVRQDDGACVFVKKKAMGKQGRKHAQVLVISAIPPVPAAAERPQLLLGGDSHKQKTMRYLL